MRFVFLVLILAAIGSVVGTAIGRNHISTGRHHHRHALRALTSTAHECRLHGSGVWSYPDKSCTPGAWIDKLPTNANKARALVCDDDSYNPRPSSSITSKLKQQVVADYGLPAKDGHGYAYESDHKFPVWLGGATTRANLWPEKDYAGDDGNSFEHNPKDHLEVAVVYNKVCRSRTMTVGQARRVFEVNNWLREYRRYVGPTGG
jgi:hypothetical protein